MSGTDACDRYRQSQRMLPSGRVIRWATCPMPSGGSNPMTCRPSLTWVILLRWPESSTAPAVVHS